MSEEERAALVAERATLERKLKKRRDEPGFGTNTAALEQRIADIDAALAEA